MQEINDFFGRCFDFLKENSKYGLPVAMILVGIYLLGLIFNWRWTLQRGGSSDFTSMWIEMFGERVVRFGKAIIAILSLLCLLYLYIRL